MGKASSAKKVARAARTGGGATRRARSGRSFLWPAFMTVVVVLGTTGVVMSRAENQSAAAPMSAPGRDPAPPRVGDHWHAAYGFDICGKFAPPITDQTDPVGIHTHGDGVIHVHPFKIKKGNPFTGRYATLTAFMRTVHGQVTNTEVRLPGGTVKRNGMKCGPKPAKVQAMTWNKGDPPDAGKPVTGPLSQLRLHDQMLVTIAFVPEGEKILQPPSAPRLDRLNDVGNQAQTSASVPLPPVAPPSSVPEPAPPSSEPGAPASEPGAPPPAP
jgi:hypothetical protein